MLVRTDADGRQDRNIAHDTAEAGLLVSGVDNQIADLAQRPVAPGFEPIVKKFGGPADLAAR